jgi:hypothetical protein
MQQAVNQGLQHAQGAVATAKAHLAAADPGDHLLAEFKAHPALRGVVDSAIAHAGRLVEAIGEINGAIRGDVLGKATADGADAGSIGSPVDAGALRAAAGKLRRNADISGLVDAFEKALSDPSFVDRVRSAAAGQKGELDLQSVRGALQQVDVRHVGAVSRRLTTRASRTPRKPCATPPARSPRSPTTSVRRCSAW